MKLRRFAVTCLVIALLLSPLNAAAGDVKKKEEAVASIEKRKAELTRMSDQIWSFAETALRETRSSKLLAAPAHVAPVFRPAPVQHFDVIK